MSTPGTAERGARQRSWPVLEITAFLLTINAGVVFVLFADLQEAYGLTDTDVGLIASAGFVSALVVTLGFAPIADRGHVVVVGSIGLAGAILAGFGFALATTAPTLIASRAGLGIGFGLFSVAARKSIVGAEIEGSGARMGRFLSFMVAGFLLGPPLGAVLAPVGLWAPFVVPAVLVTLLAPFAVQALRAAEIAVSSPRYRDMFKLTADPVLQGAMLLQMVIFGWIGVFDSTIDRHLTEQGVGNLGTAAILVVIGAPLVILPSWAGGWAERVGARRAVAIGLVVALCGYAGYGAVIAWSSVLIAGVANTVGESFMFPGLQLATVQRTGTERSAIGQTLLEAVGTSAAAAAAFLAPAIFSAHGPRTLYGGYAAGSLVFGAIAVWRMRALDAAPPPIGEPVPAPSAVP